MKPTTPYLPWFHGDFLRSTAGWTLSERGAYFMLLASSWEIGPLPDDISRLANIAGTDSVTMTSLWVVVGKKFKAISAGLINERLEAHRQNLLDYRARQSTGGRKGALKRWGNRVGKVVELRPKSEPNGGANE